MSKILYVSKKFQPESLVVIERANNIIQEYAEQGYDLTIRQLFYQFVSRDWLANTQRNYKRLGNIISDARRAGLIDWSRIVDRTRYLRTFTAWNSPDELVDACSRQFNVDFWANQDYRPEVYIEKDALIGVLETACNPWRVPYFSCRGYTSDSEAWSAAQRIRGYRSDGKTPIIFHLGDHDPSGLDMTRDVTERIQLFTWFSFEVKRIALNMNQVEEYNPPPNTAKETDSRFAKYRDEYGDESWELDALPPTTIGQLIADEMEAIIDKDRWKESEKERDEGRRLLGVIADKWDKITKKL